MPTKKLRLTTASKVCPPLALLAALSSPAWAEGLDPGHSVVKDAEDIQVSVNFPQAKTGDLYIAADVGGVLYFYTDHGWAPTPLPREYSKTYLGTKQINLGNSSGIAPGIYPVYQVVTTPNAPDVYDTRNWIGGLASLGQTSFQVKLPAQISGDLNGDGWADDDANHDGYHDDDSNHDGAHDDDANRDGYHDDDANHDAFHDDDANHDGYHDDDGNHDGYHDDDANHDGQHDSGNNNDSSHDSHSSDSSHDSHSNDSSHDSHSNGSSHDSGHND